jgi:hypothetical protein
MKKMHRRRRDLSLSGPLQRSCSEAGLYSEVPVIADQ